jgi:hypothetical protein
MAPERAERQRRRRLQAVFEQAANIGRFGTAAKAFQWRVPKTNGGTRTITSFHWVDKARQLVLKSALTPFADIHPAQFMLAHDPSRRGPAEVRKALLAALSECRDDSLFLHFDVVKFHDAISHDWVERNLGLDQRIIQRQVHLGGMKITPLGVNPVRDHHEAMTERDRRGLPQGSALSSLIAEQVMASVLRSAAALDGLPVFAWSDNVGVIVPRERASAIESLVREAFRTHGAGPFQLTMTANPVRSTFKFLGTSYRTTERGPIAFIPWEVMSAWERTIGEELLVCWTDEIGKIERRIAAKAAAWAWFDGFEETHKAVLALLASRREFRDPAFQHPQPEAILRRKYGPLNIYRTAAQ